MKIPFYQNEWFNINLLEIAKDVSHPLQKVAGENVYHIIYDKLLNKKAGILSSQWVKGKYNLSDWLFKYFNKNNLNQSSILSIGCGLGIVEQPLIQKGIKIDLQECQNISIQYFKNNYPDDFQKTKFIISQDLKEVSNNSYEVVMAITSTYCLTDDILADFFNSVQRILKKNGIFIWYETALSMNDIYSYFKNLRFPQNGLLWGWKRSKKMFIKKAKKNKLVLSESYYFDSFNHLITPKTIFGIPIGKEISWQMLVFKKND